MGFTHSRASYVQRRLFLRVRKSCRVSQAPSWCWSLPTQGGTLRLKASGTYFSLLGGVPRSSWRFVAWYAASSTAATQQSILIKLTWLRRQENFSKKEPIVLVSACWLHKRSEPKQSLLLQDVLQFSCFSFWESFLPVWVLACIAPDQRPHSGGFVGGRSSRG